MNSMDCKACCGCKHRKCVYKQWCYMFKENPDILPCAQHDMFKLFRKISGDLIYKSVKRGKK